MLKSILFAGIICAIYSKAHSASETTSEDDEIRRTLLIQEGFSAIEVDKLLPIFGKYHVLTSTAEDVRNLYHLACQVFDFQGKSIEFPETPEKERNQLAWKELEAQSDLKKQINYWKNYGDVNLLDANWKAMVFKNGCLLYVRAYEAAKDGEKPDAAELFQ